MDIKSYLNPKSLTEKAKSKALRGSLVSLPIFSYFSAVPAIAGSLSELESRAINRENAVDKAYRDLKETGATPQELSRARDYQEITDRAVLGLFNKYAQQGDNALKGGQYDLAGQKYESAEDIIIKAFSDDNDSKYQDSLGLISHKKEALNKIIRDKRENAIKAVNKVKAELLLDKVGEELKNSQIAGRDIYLGSGKTLADLLGKEKFGEESKTPLFVVYEKGWGDSEWAFGEDTGYVVGEKKQVLTDSTIGELEKLFGGKVKCLKNSKFGGAEALIIVRENLPFYISGKTIRGLEQATTTGDGSGQSIGKENYRWIPEENEHNVTEFRYTQPGFFDSQNWEFADMKKGSLREILSEANLNKSNIILYQMNKKGDCTNQIIPNEAYALIIRPDSHNEYVNIAPHKKTITIGKAKSGEGSGTTGSSASGSSGGGGGGGGVGGGGK